MNKKETLREETTKKTTVKKETKPAAAKTTAKPRAIREKAAKTGKVVTLAHGVGRRKTSVARAWLKKGSGAILVNGKDVNGYFEVADTHTYLVGNYGIIAHNVVLPVAATIGFTIPLSIAEGGTLGIAFGPIGIIGGIVIGGVIGFAIDAYRNGHLKKSRLTLDLNELDRRMHYANETPVVELPVQAPEITIPEKKQEGVDSQPDQPKAENPEGKVKTVEEILTGTKPGKKTDGPTKQFEKPGGFPEAIKDFESLKPSNVREIKNGNTGFIGDLPDGRTVNVRLGSSDKRPTLEIQNKSRTKYTKIRYGNK